MLLEGRSLSDAMNSQMQLTEERKDTLIELVNIGYARAAAALSDLTGHRITLRVPEVSVHATDEITPALQEVIQGEVTCVHQMFGGPICGNAVLLFDRNATLSLAGLLTDNRGCRTLDEPGRDAISEVGNVVLNACLGAFSNLMKMNIKFTVPHLQIDQVQGILQSVRISDEGLKHAMILRTRFDIRRSGVTGFLVIILGLTYLERVIDGLEEWGAQ